MVGSATFPFVVIAAPLSDDSDGSESVVGEDSSELVVNAAADSDVELEVFAFVVLVVMSVVLVVDDVVDLDVSVDEEVVEVVVWVLVLVVVLVVIVVEFDDAVLVLDSRLTR